MNILIAGTRTYEDSAQLNRKAWEMVAHEKDPQIITGCANGADQLARKFAKTANLKLKVYYAKWSTEGRAAGPIRNRQMAKATDKALIFWDGKSKGAKNMIEELLKEGVPEIRIIRI